MKKQRLLWAAGMILAAASVSAASAGSAGSFEGEVDYHITAPGKPDVELRYFLKGDKVRVDTRSQGRDQSALMDLAAWKMAVLMPEQKMYVNVALPEKRKASKPEGKVRKTGKTDVLLGRKVQEWIYEGKAGEADIWASPGMGHFPKIGSGPANAWAEAVRDEGLFPLKVTYRDGSDKGETTMTAVKIAGGKLADSLFEVPKDYRKMDATGMLGATQGR